MTRSKQRSLMYSQADEERYIVEAVSHFANTGKLLDIGAWHPTEFSNSRRLIELGFSAILIEPSPEPFLSLLKEYGDSEKHILICAAVWLEAGLIKLHATADAVSTIDDKEYARWKETGGFYGSFLTNAITMDDIFNRYGGNFEFVNFDAEGVSVDLFLRMLELGPRPKCCCVEIDQGRDEELASRAQAAGYRSVNDAGYKVLGNGCNVI